MSEAIRTAAVAGYRINRGPIHKIDEMEFEPLFVLPKRYCIKDCGTVLRQSNPTLICGMCERKENIKWIRAEEKKGLFELATKQRMDRWRKHE